MTVTIDFQPKEERTLRQCAAAIGQDVQTFIREAAMDRASRPDLASILAPIHEATLRSGVTVEEIDTMADRARDEVRQQRRALGTAKAP